MNMWAFKINALGIILISVTIMFVLVLCEESVNNKKRKAKFLSFDTSVEGGLDVELDFSIPFVKIPFKKTVDSAFGSDLMFPTINVNIVGLALGGLLILGSAVILPFIMKNYAVQEHHHRDSKLLDYSDFKMDALLDLGHKFFGTEGNLIQGCALRVACLAAQKATGSNSVHTLQKITSNVLLSNIMNTTAFDTAFRNGYEGRTCQYLCPMRDEQLNVMIENFPGLSNS